MRHRIKPATVVALATVFGILATGVYSSYRSIQSSIQNSLKQAQEYWTVPSPVTGTEASPSPVGPVSGPFAGPIAIIALIGFLAAIVGITYWLYKHKKL